MYNGIGAGVALDFIQLNDIARIGNIERREIRIGHFIGGEQEMAVVAEPAVVGEVVGGIV